MLCAECHASNALGAPGVTGVSNVSNAMHRHHASLPDITPDVDGCYNCHPGPTTRCLRDVMSQDEGMQCQDCHGDMMNVAQNVTPWLNEPRCDNASLPRCWLPLDQCLVPLLAGAWRPLLRGLPRQHARHRPQPRTKRCHQVHQLCRGRAGTLRTCTVCHITQPSGEFKHSFTPKVTMPRIYLPTLYVAYPPQ